VRVPVTDTNLRLDASEFWSYLWPMAKDTQKALVIICAAIAFGVGLLVWANYIRPHGY